MNTKLVIFGITGDLSGRKLLPALRDIITAKPEQNLEIIGVSRREVGVDELLDDSLGYSNLSPITSIFTMDLAQLSDYKKLRDHLNIQEDEQVLMYLSVPPSSATQIVDFLGEAGLNDSNIKLLFEKPFGLDLVSAQDMIERTNRFFKEEQIYRIDHYMAKEVANGLIHLRSDARNHHHRWDKNNVKAVEIVASETIGVEGRATFYEQTGALRDLLQGHLLQLLALVLMHIPADFESSRLPEYRLKALEKLEPADPTKTKRMQYLGYQEEVENIGSLTETFAELNLQSSDERWAGVPILLQTGKRLQQKRTYVRVIYRDGSEDIFEEGLFTGPDGAMDAYERVLMSAIRGSKYLFISNSEVIRSWEIVQPVLDAWSMNDEQLETY